GPSPAAGPWARASPAPRARVRRARRSRRGRFPPTTREAPPRPPPAAPARANAPVPRSCCAASQLELEHVLRDLGLADRLADLGEVRLFAPKLELVAHAEQHRALLDTGRCALARRQKDSSVAVRLDMRRRADQLHLEAAVHGLDRRQCGNFVADPLPLLVGENPEAAVFERAVGHDEAIAALGPQLPMGGRNRDTSLLVERESRFTLEHDPLKTTKTHLRPP